MSQLTDLFYKLSHVQHPTCYLETGCYKGLNLERIISQNRYEEYHSIELDPAWYEYNRKRFLQSSNVFMHLGDSSTVLNELVLPRAATIFLDAHYSGPGTAHGKLETPLLEELMAISEKGLDRHSVIVIDDMRMFGIRGVMPGDGFHYHPFESDWSNITLDRIRKIMGPKYFYLTNHFSWLTEGPKDQLVIFKTTKMRGYLMVMLGSSIKLWGINSIFYKIIKNLAT